MKHLLPLLLGVVLAACGLEAGDVGASGSAVRAAGISATPIGRFTHGSFEGTAAEIGAFDPGTRRLLVVNGELNAIDVLDLSDPTNPTLIGRVQLTAFGGNVNSVAVHDGLAGAAVQGNEKTDPGNAVFFDVATLAVIGAVPVGALPDMITFSHNGRYAVTANEGEPNSDYSIDPEGSVSVIDLSNGVPAASSTAGFAAYNDAIPPGVRVSGPGASAAQDFEPEYVTISHDSRTAWVTLQENNALAIVDLATATVTSVTALGTKDHSLAENALDASDRDDAIRITTWPVHGLYMPDAIDSFRVGGATYLITANEGDTREYDTFTDEGRVRDLVLDPVAFPNAAYLQQSANLGRLKTPVTDGDTDGDGDHDEIYSFGARSFSIRDAAGNLVFDSGDAIEQTFAAIFPDNFNADENENDADARSDDKGPEPEGVTVARVFGRQYAFLGIERMGGIMIWDVSDPSAPVFVEYVSTRDFSVAPGSDSDAGDLAPEGVLVVSAEDSPTGNPLLIGTYEVSSTTRIFELTPN